MNATVHGVIGFLILVAMTLTLLIQYYVANKYTEHFESFLPNCKYITDNRNIYRHAGILGKLMRTGSISLVLAFPKLFIWRGIAKSEDIQHFPSHEKRTLLCLLTLHITLLMALALSHFLLPAT